MNKITSLHYYALLVFYAEASVINLLFWLFLIILLSALLVEDVAGLVLVHVLQLTGLVLGLLPTQPALLLLLVSQASCNENLIK